MCTTEQPTQPLGEAILTIGHSNHPWSVFVAMLRQHAVASVVDVRSSPFSRFCPQFNRDALERRLESYGIRYEFLGKELGARREEACCYEGRRAKYELIVQSPLFQRGRGNASPLVAVTSLNAPFPSLR